MIESYYLHNPNCSKSKEALTLLQSRGIQPQIIDYINGGLSYDLLKTIIQALGLPPKNILRTKEEEFQALNIDLNDAEEIIAAILSHPKLLERPIFVNKGKAVIGRPPENVLKII